MEGLLDLQAVHAELPVSRKAGEFIFRQELVQTCAKELSMTSY